MKYRAGFLNVACVWVVILLPGVDAGHALKKCSPKERTALTKKSVQDSLERFDNANGNNLGTWSPAFHELDVHTNSSSNGSIIQCKLSFIDQGLVQILLDQRDNLNPNDNLLHHQLEKTICDVNLLANCVQHIHGGDCFPKPPAPKMPIFAFDRKRWSHSLLKAAIHYLGWLEKTFEVRDSKVKGTKNKKRKVAKPMHLKYLKASGYLL